MLLTSSPHDHKSNSANNATYFHYRRAVIGIYLLFRGCHSLTVFRTLGDDVEAIARQIHDVVVQWEQSSIVASQKGGYFWTVALKERNQWHCFVQIENDTHIQQKKTNMRFRIAIYQTLRQALSYHHLRLWTEKESQGQHCIMKLDVETTTRIHRPIEIN